MMNHELTLSAECLRILGQRISSLAASARRALLAAFMGLGCVSDVTEADTPDWSMCVAACAKISCLGPTTSREVAECVERCLDVWEDAVSQGHDCAEHYADVIACFGDEDCEGHIAAADGDLPMCAEEDLTMHEHCEDIEWRHD